MFKKASRPLALAASAVFSACQMMAFVLYPYFSETSGLPLSTIISGFSLGSFLFLWGSPFWARRSEKWGRQPVLAFGLFGLLLSQAALLLLVLGSISHGLALALLWGSRILYGLTSSAIVPVSQAIMADRSGEADRMKAMTRHSMSLHVGRLLGPFLVWFGLLYSASAPLWLCTILIGVLSFLLTFIPIPGQAQAASPAARRWFWPATTQARLLVAIAFGVTTLVGVLQSSLTQQLQIRLGLDSHAAAQFTLRFLLASSLVTILVQALVQARVKSPWQGTFPAGAACLVASSLLLTRFSSAAELWWALPLFAAGIALLTPSYTAALSLEGSLTQGEAAGLLGVAHTLGYAVGGLITAGILALGLAPLIAGLAVALLLLLLVISLKNKQTETSLQPIKREQP